MNMRRTPLLCGLLLAYTGTTAQADDWFVRVGAHTVDPKSDNGSLAGGALEADVGNDWRPTVTAEYFLSPNWGIEVLAALPFKHEIELNGVKAGETKHLPPTFSVQYYFNPEGKVSPFVGAGLNYTLTFSEKEKGPLVGTNIDIGNSFGLAAQAGLRFQVSEDWDMTVDARWMDIDADVKVNGNDLGTANVDPMVYSVMFGKRF